MWKEWWAVRDQKELTLCIKEIGPSDWGVEAMTTLINEAVEKKKSDVEDAAQLLRYITSTEAGLGLGIEALTSAFRKPVEAVEDTAFDVPAIYTLLATMTYNSGLTLGAMTQLVSPLIEAGAHQREPPALRLMTAYLLLVQSKEADGKPEVLRAKAKAAGLGDLRHLMGPLPSSSSGEEEDALERDMAVAEYLEKKGLLEALAPHLVVLVPLRKAVNGGAEPQEALAAVNDSLPVTHPSRRTVDFGRSVVSVVIRYVASQTLLLSGKEAFSSGSSGDLSPELLEKEQKLLVETYGKHVLRELVRGPGAGDAGVPQVGAVWAAHALAQELSFPSGYLKRLLSHLQDAGVIDRASLQEWRTVASRKGVDGPGMKVVVELIE